MADYEESGSCAVGIGADSGWKRHGLLIVEGATYAYRKLKMVVVRR